MVSLINFIQLFTNPHNPNSERMGTFCYSPFQILGIDVMIDENLKAWLLEINENPTMNYFICKQERACNHKEC